MKPYPILLFDLDDTLYPRSAGVMDQIRTRMIRYMCEHMDLTPDAADALRRHYFLAYGTTMRGLQINHHIDPNEFLPFVHDIPLEEYLRPNPALDAALDALPQLKVIFTNASREHAEAVLAALGIRRHFDRIVDVRDVEYESKPQPGAYDRICRLLEARPEQCILVEDNARNLQPAKALGMITVLVRENGGAPPDGVDYVMDRVEDIGAIPPLRPR